MLNFLISSDLWAAEGQVNISDAFDFSDKIEVIGRFAMETMGDEFPGNDFCRYCWRNQDQ